jgi:DNA mismatch endonuclease (patch repair protein)
MGDIYTKGKRSLIMAAIPSKGTEPEDTIAAILGRQRYVFDRNDKRLPGAPDFSFVRRRKVIFVNGCFWHGHRNCKRGTLPESNRDFWKSKIESNIKRDWRVRKRLNRQGFNTLTIWQCKLTAGSTASVEKRIRKFLAPARTPQFRRTT